MRRVLLVLLGFGVFAGYGSAIASARFHARQRGDSCGWARESQRPEEARPAIAPAAPAQQTIVVPAAAPAPAQQIFLIMPGAQAASGVPQVITVPVPAAAAVPAPAAVPANP